MTVRRLLVLLMMTVASCNAQVTKHAPTGRVYYRAIEGGGERVSIDSITPINTLIKRLEKPWQFVETGKMYWIGYTDDMYSIAAHGDSAIKPLMDFIHAAKEPHAKFGAIYTLHLIGIHCTIVGRFSEQFVDKQAREALLSLLTNNEFGEDVMSLLVRDSWQSDVPKLFSAIKDDPDAWYIVSALNHYRLNGYPLDKQVPNDIGKLQFTITSTAKQSSNGPENQLENAIRSLRASNYPSVVIDNKLFNLKKLWGEMEYGLDGIYNSSSDNTIDELVGLAVVSSGIDHYGETGSRINYYVKNNKLYLCSPETSRKIILKWWDNQPQAYKQQFMKDGALNSY